MYFERDHGLSSSKNKWRSWQDIASSKKKYYSLWVGLDTSCTKKYLGAAR